MAFLGVAPQISLLRWSVQRFLSSRCRMADERACFCYRCGKADELKKDPVAMRPLATDDAGSKRTTAAAAATAAAAVRTFIRLPMSFEGHC